MVRYPFSLMLLILAGCSAHDLAVMNEGLRESRLKRESNTYDYYPTQQTSSVSVIHSSAGQSSTSSTTQFEAPKEVNCKEVTGYGLNVKCDGVLMNSDEFSGKDSNRPSSISNGETSGKTRN